MFDVLIELVNEDVDIMVDLQLGLDFDHSSEAFVDHDGVLVVIVFGEEVVLVVLLNVGSFADVKKIEQLFIQHRGLGLHSFVVLATVEDCITVKFMIRGQEVELLVKCVDIVNVDLLIILGLKVFDELVVEHPCVQHCSDQG